MRGYHGSGAAPASRLRGLSSRASAPAVGSIGYKAALVAMPAPHAAPGTRAPVGGTSPLGGRMRGPAHSGKLARSAVQPNCRKAFGWATADRRKTLPPRETPLLVLSLRTPRVSYKRTWYRPEISEFTPRGAPPVKFDLASVLKTVPGKIRRVDIRHEMDDQCQLLRRRAQSPHRRPRQHSHAETFDANRRLGEIALRSDSAAHWIDRVTAATLAGRSRSDFVTVTFHRDELEAFVRGMRITTRSLLGIAQPVPPPVPKPSPSKRQYAHLVMG
jgi:hypothetical protein